MKETEVLLTGHTGALGTVVLRTLETHFPGRVAGVSSQNGYDLTKPETLPLLEARFPSVRTIVHLAGQKGVPRSWRVPGELFSANFNSTLTVYELARKRSASVVLLSSYLYGAPRYLPIDEQHPIGCNNPYAQSKLQAEQLADTYSRFFSVRSTVLRPFNLYGAASTRRDENIDVITHIVDQVLEGDRVKLKDLSPKRDYLHVDDLADAVSRVVTTASCQDGVEVFNLGTGSSYSVAEIVEVIARCWGREFPVDVANEVRPNEIPDCYADYRKFQARFSWAPRVTLEEGIERLLEARRSAPKNMPFVAPSPG